VRLTQAAVRLLTSNDALSGQISFSQFQKALQDTSPMTSEAGRPNVIQDQASSIIADNCGAPEAPPGRLGALGKKFTDISADPFIRAASKLDKLVAKGPFSGNVVVQSNRPSAGNPLVARLAEPHSFGATKTMDDDVSEDPYGVRDMTRSATRMFVSGELDKAGFEKLLARFCVRPGPESELRKLINSHEQVGDGNFQAITRALAA
ncbi:unnamed protein product, partial [Polarella glacialis]